MGEGARGGPAPLGDDEANGVGLHRSVASLVDAMRDLLSNVRLPDLPNDADGDDSGDSEDDDEPQTWIKLFMSIALIALYIFGYILLFSVILIGIFYSMIT